MNANQPLSKPSLIWGLILMFSAIVLSPFYFYSSGLPQPGHVVMLVASIALIALNTNLCMALVKSNKAGSFFLILLLFVNIAYAAYYQDKSFLLSLVHWLYGFVLFLAVVTIAKDRNIAMWSSRFILSKLALVVGLYLFGLGGYKFWPRYDYFFNGPNQLAYFAICMLLVFVAATRGKWSVSFYVVYTLAFFVVISTGGRSAYLALLPLIALLLWISRKQLLHGLLLLLLLVAVNLIFKSLSLPLYKPVQQGDESSVSEIIVNDNNINISSITKDRFDNLMLEDHESDNNSIVLQLKARGYMRAIEYPRFLLYGAGQGKDERFGDVKGSVYEIHSSLLAIWFYYGIGGLILFALFIWRIFDIKVNILFLMPLFVYGLFTYGLRSPYFWVALAFLAVAPNIFFANKKADEL